MDPSQLFSSLLDFLSTPVFWFRAFVVTLQDLLLAAAVLAVAWLVAHWARRLASGLFAPESEEEEGGSKVAEAMTYWTVMVAGALLAVDVLGIDAALVRDALNTHLFALGADNPVSLSTLLFATVVVALTWVLSRVLRRALDRTFRSRSVDEGTIAIAKKFMHYAVIAVGLTLALQNLGVNLGAIFAAGAVFAVGFGFAMQTIAQNFVSGLILLVERSIKPGDVLETEGTVVVVEKMGIRATVARTRDEEEIIIPNSLLVQNTVKNYTLRDSLYRVRAQVGVEYRSDMQEVMRVLQEAADAIEWRFKGQDPVVVLTEFGSSSVNFEISVWMQDPWTAPRARSRLMEAVWNTLKAAEITIAFPQMDVHFDPPIEAAADRFPRAG